MRKRTIGVTLCWSAVLLLIASLPYAYKAIDLGVTAEEGLRYSVPGMKASTSYSAASITRAEFDFRRMDRTADEWGSLAEVLFLACVSSAFTGIWILRSARKAS